MSDDLPTPPTSARATMKQGGSAGSAVDRLNRASAIRKHTNPSRPQSGFDPSPDEDGPALERSALERSAFDDAFSPMDSDTDEEFDVVNPLYEHAGAGARFRTDTMKPGELGSTMRRVFVGVRKRMRTPTGRVTVELLKATGLAGPNHQGDALTVRVRASLNGWSARSGACAPGANPKINATLHVPYYKVEVEADDPLQTQDVGELQIEINDELDDSFVASVSIAEVTMFTETPKKLVLDLTSEQGTSAGGTLELTITYHRSTFVDKMGLRGKWILEYPQAVVSMLKAYIEAIPGAVRRFVAAGLPGLSGGAGSWVVMGVCCIPFVLTSLGTNWSWAFRQWILFVPLYCYFVVSWPVIFGWAFGTMITTFALHGYPGALKVPALHVQPWIRGWALHVRVTADDAAFGNPPGFPLENFGECARTDIKGSILLRHIWDIITLNYKKVPLKKVPDFRLLAKFDIDYIEFENVTVDFQLFEGKFNIYEYSRMLAEGQARNVAWFRGYMKASDPTPNELEIRIIRAKNLVKTRTTNKTLKQIAKEAAGVGQFGRNAVVDAFEETEDMDSDDEGTAASNAGEKRRPQQDSEDIPAPLYGGGGPPQFNPMDVTVKDKKNQGHFDPYVVVTLRKDVQKTHTQSKTNSPMWNETLYFHAPDAATVVLVQVFNRELTGDTLIGQWLMTLKWMLGDPYYCWHEKGMEVTPDRWMRGWFPLMNKNFRGVGRCGKLEMAMQWRYVPEAKLRRRNEMTPLTALQQLQENSAESRLRMGDMARVKYWLNHEPFLYDIRRVTVRGVKFYVQDLFRGYVGRAEQRGVERSNHVAIERLDYLSEFRPRHGDMGITTFKVVYHFFRGIAPKVLDSATSHANVGSAIGQIGGSMTYHMGQSLGQGVSKLFRGEVDRVGAVQSISSSVTRVGKAADRAVQLLHRTVTQKENEKEFKFLVTAEDEDFLLDRVEIKGYLARNAVKAPGAQVTDLDMEKESHRKGGFRRKFFELKGHTIFFRRNKEVSKSSMYAVTYKLPLKRCAGAIFFVTQNELILNMQEEGHLTRLKLYSNESEAGEDDAEEGGASNPTLQDWLDALKANGVPCFSWQREGGGL